MIRHLINYAGNLFEWYIACSFYSALHPRKFSQKTSLLLGAAITLVQFAGNALFLGKPALASSSLLFVSAFVFTYLLSLLYVSKWYWKLLEAAVLFILNAAVEFAYGMLMQIVLHADHETVQNNILYFFIGTITCKTITLFLVRFIRLRNLRKNAAAPKSVIVPMLLFPFGTILVFVFAGTIAFQMQKLSLIIITVVTMTVLIAANIILLRVIEQQSDYIRTKEMLRHARAHIETQVEHYNALYRYQSETRKMRHDEKNKLLALSGLLRAGDVEAAQTMLDNELALSAREAEQVLDTGNPVIDAVLQSNRADAKAHGVSLRVRAQMEEAIQIDEMQLSVLLGSAVDNAVEAAAKMTTDDPRCIDVTIRTCMGRIYLCVENPTAEENGDVHNLHTAKGDPLHHGFGLQSIRSIVETYDGSLSITWTDHRFRMEIGLANGA